MIKGGQIEYLVVGHVSRDIVDAKGLEPRQADEYLMGGTVSFSSQIACALGMRTAILTSTAPDFDVQQALPTTDIVCVPAPETTTFSNIYTDSGRRQIVHALAGWLSAENLPDSWRDIPIVHLGPITNQVDPQLVNAFPNSLIGLTPQGWMRKWDENGHVYPIRMDYADILLPKADVVIISEEDLREDSDLAYMRELSRLLVVTHGYNGCVIYQDDDAIQIPAPQVEEINPTGAGDIFATAFLVEMYRSQRNVIRSAEFANLIASQSVAQPDLAFKVATIRQIANR